MRELPAGTVTFVFTDIQGSTELVSSLGDRYPAVLQRHNDLVREAFARHVGIEVQTEGDAFFFVFTSASAAVRAAVDGQRVLNAERWPDGAEVLVRMGVHTGEAVIGGDGYVGLDVHRASRIASAGHGGQILVSDATRALIEPALPEGAGLRDLGRHRLKGLPAAERIFEVTVDGLPSTFPPLASLDVRPNNLPSEMTSFIGRGEQIREAIERLSATRLLTLTGPGGTGKTRFGIRVAEEVLADYEHGCWFVALDALRDPELIPSTIAGALGVKVAADRSVMSALEAWLAHRQVLLVLDNFEQVTAGARYVAELLSAAPRLRVVATSRSPLHIYGEQEYPVPPLTTGPELRTPGAPSAESLSQYEAVQLFIERAMAAQPHFRVTNANAPAVAEICARLEGLPLAVELAAARIKLLSPEQILHRLQRSLSLLASAAQDVPERQRTLLGAIDWSHELLSEPERRLFACLSVFRGGFTLEAAEQVCGADDFELDVLDGTASLLDKSLLRREELPAETRLTMLQTIREYASERLTQSGDLDTVASRHALHYFTLATDAEHRIAGPDQLEWLDRLTREHDNLRAAFSRALDLGMLDEALRAAGAMWRFWQLRGHFAEARSIFERLLAPPGPAAAARATGLIGAGGIAYWMGDFQAMAAHYREARELYESEADLGGMAQALYNESYAPLLLQGDIRAARALLEQALHLYRQSGNAIGAAEAESALAFSHHFAGEPELAIPYQERAVNAFRAADARWHLSDNLLGMSSMYSQAGDWARAVAAMRESLALASELGIDIGLAMVFEWAGAAAVWVGDRERGARLLGKADDMKERLGGGAPSQVFQSGTERAKALDELGEGRYGQLHSEGAQLSTTEAIELANELQPPREAPPAPAVRLWGLAAEKK